MCLCLVNVARYVARAQRKIGKMNDLENLEATRSEKCRKKRQQNKFKFVVWPVWADAFWSGIFRRAGKQSIRIRQSKFSISVNSK